ncbi:MAG TPA: HAMP domain-containing sensor histidine kinase [Anaerolineales bacterium]|nr:HAMP domain-containing sensor histidine kinase [Anaerolineales bacterium]
MDEVIQSVDSRNNWRQSVMARYAIGVLGIVSLSLLIFNMLMRPAFTDFGLMALFLSITALISGLAAYGSYRLGWMERSPTIRWALLGGYLLSSVLTFINVWVTARLMFFDQHDLLLATVLLLFASGMAMALGYFLSSTLTDRIRLLDRAARSIASGDLDTRLPVSGRDELALLAATFNQMASQLQGAARKKEELEALRRDLIAWVGHDLQTPLASIQAILEALSDGVVEGQETAWRYLQTAQRDIRSLSILIDDLFQMAQLDAGGLPLNLENNSLSDLISDTLESFREVAARQGVALTGSVSPGVDPVLMDAQRVGRVLNNLVSNALRHTHSGGSVAIHASPTPAGVRVEVTDTGEGIPAADLPYVFERFYRGEKSRSRTTGGAGLGLAIARGIIEAHGGEIGVESQPGWTRFTFRLPGNRSL